jgi:hypothetical protein
MKASELLGLLQSIDPATEIYADFDGVDVELAGFAWNGEFNYITLFPASGDDDDDEGLDLLPDGSSGDVNGNVVDPGGEAGAPEGSTCPVPIPGAQSKAGKRVMSL